jgi:hypothetical protein
MNCLLNPKTGMKIEPRQSHSIRGEGERNTCGKLGRGSTTSTGRGASLASESPQNHPLRRHAGDPIFSLLYLIFYNFIFLIRRTVEVDVKIKVTNI